MRDDTPRFERPIEPCHLFEPGIPEAKLATDGWLCGGMQGQPCQRCLLYAVGVRGQAEWFLQQERERGKR